MGWVGGAGGGSRLGPYHRPGRGFQGRGRRGCAEPELASGAKRDRDAQECCHRHPKQPCLGGARRSLNASAGDLGGHWDEAQSRRPGPGAATAASEGALAGREWSPRRVGPPLLRLPPPPLPPGLLSRSPCVPPVRGSGNARLGLVVSCGRSRSRGGHLHPESPTASPSNRIADPPAPGPPPPSPGPFPTPPGQAWKNSERDSQRRDAHWSSVSRAG
ncbi:PREDICTED: formin-like protein 5 [Colobus angolensis palliatus]|uniref:formin-like protein 5 n=1 Tax=Colobus angolensis palliatus TaxID=336983 RepID=UPI0005F4D8FE|nr:PREDICTED: formin-like protein 5 [Colobus angolensis palliatus]